MTNRVPTSADAQASARRSLHIEAQAILDLAARLDDSLTRAVDMLLACQGRVVVSGLGKTGHIARKIAATLASTGTPAFFMHAAEAAHGDLGMLTGQDVLVALSYSGSGQELLTILPVTRRLGAEVIAITGNPASELAQLADVHLDASVAHEACPLNLAPTASTTASLALGDALAVACLEARGFGPDDFARSHPGGALGRRLLTHVRDVMRQGQALPTVTVSEPLSRALEEMSAKGMGMTAVVDDNFHPVGIFTDGDLRRLIERKGDLRGLTVAEGMTRNPRNVDPDALAVEAARIMDEKRLSQMLVINDDGVLIGALHMHDLMAAKVV
ncbi:KpsF/GutQ family sugar-phosphate isomerase [Bordetella holmesii]|uniref:Sugar isomerase, KpsF/GutQ family n=2 Tax=Bordetella holmesii TaxID=35814 RepID=A0A158M8B5_9BORD|nr:KpsF/GutQ family sugar-phosphate isomerase [Bordetella holmesii]AHV93631.1 sugar isomerase, KpsF/GutQ family protein [Bordetella holmesii ATCC 51541]AIT26496.1 sugar isomerase, KpsF/GutQ family protein [Bordetella holmesii 44057]EWM41601.1 sugar isomerase, KpsF/GutQ family protein [Bordetella holmesii 41130]EWM47071.1 sugar isomerase, KpsF/GutQ family protein [Bordetella holmesii 35009]EWM51238.1 sugar isomerase, KpsF/GutQ family protein [Bordetella holmesii 70147]